MLLSIDGRFAYLAMTKTGSTSVENALRPHCNVMFTGHHRVTHMPAHHFERYLRPYLEMSGIEVETVCQLRHPIDWLESWWRYRSKPGEWEREVDSSGVSFETFALEFAEGAERPYLQHIHRPQAFLCNDAGELIVGRVFRFEEMEYFGAFLSERLGTPIKIGKHNVSPKRFWKRLGMSARKRMEAFFAPELDIWESRTDRA